MLDLASALIAVALFAVFVGGLALSVADPPLVVIVLAVIAMAAFDLWRDATGRSWALPRGAWKCRPKQAGGRKAQGKGWSVFSVAEHALAPQASSPGRW